MDASFEVWEEQNLCSWVKKSGIDSFVERSTECKKYMVNLSDVTYCRAAWNTITCCNIIHPYHCVRLYDHSPCVSNYQKIHYVG
jgi:hypothetical protein